jgi:hypothetical protein
MPEGILDRNADVWEGLIAVADAVGGSWPDRARVAAVALVALAKGESPSLGLRLLSDLRTVFANHEVLSTADLLISLTLIEEAPWNDLRGKPLDPRRLANILSLYAIRSKVIRTGTSTPRGYQKSEFFDAWLRYLPTMDGLVGVVPVEGATSATSATPATEEPAIGLFPEAMVDDDS